MNEITKKVEEIIEKQLSLKLTGEQFIQSITSLIEQEVLKGRIDEQEDYSCCIDPATGEQFFDDVTVKHAELRIEQLQEQLKEK